MTRVLRYPRMSACVIACVMACAVLRDACVGASLDGWAQVLLVCTAALLALALALMSCRFFVDEAGVGVGFLLRVRRVRWQDIVSCGLLQCNSRRRYLYGMYAGAADFINLLHRAPVCGAWGFVAPASRKLLRAVKTHCPFDVDLSDAAAHPREGRLRCQWHQAAVYAAMMLPGAAVAMITGGLMLLRASRLDAFAPLAALTLGALMLFGTALTLLCRLLNTLMTLPGYHDSGICAGSGMYLPWQEIRFGYVHRIAQMSGLFLLSQPPDVMHRRNAPPIRCLSMPDTQTLLIAYLMYCPHAERGVSP